MITSTVRSGSGLRHDLFGTSGSGTIEFGAAGKPMSNWPVTSDVFPSLVLVTSGAGPVVPTKPGALFLDMPSSFNELAG